MPNFVSNLFHCGTIYPGYMTGTHFCGLISCSRLSSKNSENIMDLLVYDIYKYIILILDLLQKTLFTYFDKDYIIFISCCIITCYLYFVTVCIKSMYTQQLVGLIPNVTAGIVNRTVCFLGGDDNWCYHSILIKVKNCGSYRVYLLKPTLTNTSAYCFGNYSYRHLNSTKA